MDSTPFLAKPWETFYDRVASLGGVVYWGMSPVTIRPAREEDTSVILDMIRALAEYERLSHLVIADTERLRTSLFGERPAAEVLLACAGTECVGFALFFQTYSTFLAAPGRNSRMRPITMSNTIRTASPRVL